MLTLPIAGCTVELSATPLPADGPWKMERAYWKARRQDLWLQVPDLAQYRVRDGHQVEVHLLQPKADLRNVQHFLVSTPFAALAMQRGELPLHAAALVSPQGDRAVLLCAHSGTGKSTTAAALCQQGWRLLNDDISRVVIEKGQPYVYPGVQQIRLWPHSCELLALDTTDLAFSLAGKRKLLWQPQGCDRPLPIQAIIELERPRKDDGSLTAPVWTPLQGSAIIHLLKLHTFRPPLIAGLEAALAHFQISAQLARSVPCYHLQLPPTLTPAQIAHQIAVRMMEGQS